MDGNMLGRGLFISATDTGVGKTFIGCALAQALRTAGWSVAPRKPVESGCLLQDGTLIPADAVALTTAAGLPNADWTAVNRYRLPDALAPDLAARRVGQPLYLQDLVAAVAVPAGHFRLTEGAGGLYSPLAEDALNIDLAVAVADPVLLVSEDRLGTLSVTLLCLEALTRHGLQLAAVILNRRRADAHPALANAEALARYTDAPILSVPDGCSQTATAEILAASLSVFTRGHPWHVGSV